MKNENKLIDVAAMNLRFFGCVVNTDDPIGPEELEKLRFELELDEHPWDECVEFITNWDGEDGWVIYCGEYPDEGCAFVRPEHYGAIEVARVIVACEREYLRSLVTEPATARPH
ncbi:MAG: hypothetical protein JNM17_13145 [Archangium sp.]|nr:hypothetical protein [Archangium sp.]